ncbi:beta-lactamase class C AmpC-like protein [Psychroflexus torquis ATCC 700755]|uniref:Beta-lactamase class C AmpC-like protein n=1 Tax=Psychroflexus torquis (strain ATCC 700755 / CIP 106069 / ACAM 623) TaxID=313595 RepID=K4II97_PSYTT|nr:serine hydrolase domain-containing protein [Psychroflexus torquis]AFU69523.1 beta-lactamase class C AmpC-like protein [Psychroflexus torquis ATCC 700755]
MKYFKFLTLLLFLFTAENFYSQVDSTIDNKIDSFLNKLTDEEFSGTILVAKNGNITQKRAYGLASKELDVKNKTDTKFNIASITKTFTAVAILQLHEEGKIDLNTPIGNYLKDYPNEKVKNSVTISQLLTHTAGLPNFYVTNFLDECKFKFKDVKDFVPLFVNDSLLSEPGTEYNYDAAGYVLLGLIIEEITGNNYYDYLNQNIFRKAKMINTAAYDVDAIIENKANGYTFAGDTTKPLKNNVFYLSKASPGGFHYSTVEDLFNFNKALFSYKLINKVTVDLMIKPRIKGYNTHLGYGIDVDKRYNETILGHSGGWYGISGEIIYLPKSDYTITILSNVDSSIDSGKPMVSDFFKVLLAGNI